jgi:hypothetical protein
MSTLKVNAIEKKDADQTLTVKDATLTGATITTGTFPAGHILQVKYDSNSTQSSQITTGSVDSGMSISITTSGTNNVLLTGALCVNLSGTSKKVDLVIKRNGAVILDTNDYLQGPYKDSSTDHSTQFSGSLNYLDTGASGTNVYTIELKARTGYCMWNYDGALSTMTAWEIQT